MGSDYFQNKLDVTRMRCTRKYLNCTAHAIDDQNNGRWVSANQPMVEHRPHAIQLYLDQWVNPIHGYNTLLLLVPVATLPLILDRSPSIIAVGCMSVRIGIRPYRCGQINYAPLHFTSLLGKCYSVHINASSL